MNYMNNTATTVMALNFNTLLDIVQVVLQDQPDFTIRMPKECYIFDEMGVPVHTVWEMDRYTVELWLTWLRAEGHCSGVKDGAPTLTETNAEMWNGTYIQAFLEAALSNWIPDNNFFGYDPFDPNNGKEPADVIIQFN